MISLFKCTFLYLSEVSQKHFHPHAAWTLHFPLTSTLGLLWIVHFSHQIYFTDNHFRLLEELLSGISKAGTYCLMASCIVPCTWRPICFLPVCTMSCYLSVNWFVTCLSSHCLPVCVPVPACVEVTFYLSVHSLAFVCLTPHLHQRLCTTASTAIATRHLYVQKEVILTEQLQHETIFPHNCGRHELWTVMPSAFSPTLMVG